MLSCQVRSINLDSMTHVRTKRVTHNGNFSQYLVVKLPDKLQSDASVKVG